jgi:hypothetical protein
MISSFAQADTLTLRPIANGSYTNFTTVIPLGLSHYRAVDEATANDSDYIFDSRMNIADIFYLTHPNISGEIINNVTVYARAIWVGGSSYKFHLTLHTPNGNDYYSPEFAATPVYSLYSWNWSTNPDTTLSWTANEINSNLLQAGVQTGLISDAGVKVSQIYVVVNYVSGEEDPVATFGTNPIDGYVTPDTTVFFEGKCSDNVALEELSYYGSWNGWGAKRTMPFPVNDSFYSQSVVGIPLGTWNWAVFCRDTANNTNMTLNRTITIMNSSNITTCFNLTEADTIYTLTQNATSNGTCFEIQNNNVTLDCGGYWINYSNLNEGYGVYSNSSKTTIKNCNIVQGNNLNNESYGVYSHYALLTNITNSTIHTLSYMSDAVVFSGNNATLRSSNIIVDGESADGVFVSDVNTKYATITKNNFTINNNSFGIHLGASLMSQTSHIVTNNMVYGLGNSSVGLFLNDVSNSTITNNNFTAMGNYLSYAVELQNSNNNKFTNNFINSSFDDEGNPIFDIYFLGTGINNFTNCSFERGNIGFNPGATGKVNVKWYVQVYVNDSFGTPFNGANVTIKDVDGILEFTDITDEGSIPSKEVLDYMANVTGIYEKDNHTFNATYPGYTSDQKSYNITANFLGDDIYLTLNGNDLNPPTVVLSNPPNDTWRNDVSGFSFACNNTDDINLKNSTLYGNWSTGWHANKTKNISGVNDYTTFSYFATEVPEGTYVWNCYTCDAQDNCAWAPDNFTLNNDYTDPTVILFVPQIGVGYLVGEVPFWIKCQDWQSTPQNLQLYGNWSGSWGSKATNSSPVNNEYWVSNQTISTPGIYVYNGWCNDSAGNIGWAVANKSFVVMESTNITQCLEITSPGYYALGADILNNNNTVCINISSSDVIFDGQGHTIDGVGTTSTYGIYVHNSTVLTNVTVENTVISDWYRGVDYYNIQNSSISSINSSAHFGISFTAVFNTFISNSNIVGLSNGLYLSGSNNNNISNSNIAATSVLGDGVYLLGSNNNLIVNSNVISSDLGDTIYFVSASNNSVINSNITSLGVGGVGIYFEDASNYNNFSNLNIIVTNGGGIYVVTSYNNYFSSSNISASNDNSIHLGGANNNVFTNIIVKTNNSFDFDSVNSINNIVTNMITGNENLSFTGYNFALKNASSPASDPAGYRNISHYVNATNLSSGAWLNLNISYNDAGINETRLNMSKYNGTWYTNPSTFSNNYGVDIVNNIVYANITNFGSIFAPLESINTVFNLSICGELNESNSIYTLSQNVTAPGTCFTINATNVTLDCNGYTITYATATTGSAILDGIGYDYTFIENCNIYLTSTQETSPAISFYNSDNGFINSTNITLSQKNNDGIDLTSCSGYSINNNTINITGDNSYGVFLALSNSNSFDSNIFYTNGSSSSGAYIFYNTVNNVFSNDVLMTNISSYDFSSVALSTASGTLTNEYFTNPNNQGDYVKANMTFTGPIFIDWRSSPANDPFGFRNISEYLYITGYTTLNNYMFYTIPTTSECEGSLSCNDAGTLKANCSGCNQCGFTFGTCDGTYDCSVWNNNETGCDDAILDGANCAWSNPNCVTSVISSINVINDPSFEWNNNTWTNTSTNGGIAQQSNTSQHYADSASGMTSTTSSTGTSTATLNQTINRLVTNFNYTNSLSWWAFWNANATNGSRDCYVRFSSNTSKNLYYWYNLNNAPPANDSSNVYLVITNPTWQTWNQTQRNLWQDWNTAGFAIANITNVSAICDGNFTAGTVVSTTIRPNANGTYNSTFTVYPSGEHWAAVDEIVENDADGVYSITASSNDTYNIADITLPAGATINNVTVFETAVQYNSTLKNFKIMIKSGGTAAYSSNKVTTNLLVQYNNTWTTDPATSSAWTESAVNALEVGEQLTPASGGVNVTWVYVVVTYTNPNIVYGEEMYWDVMNLSTETTINPTECSTFNETNCDYMNYATCVTSGSCANNPGGSCLGVNTQPTCENSPPTGCGGLIGCGPWNTSVPTINESNLKLLRYLNLWSIIGNTDINTVDNYIHKNMVSTQDGYGTFGVFEENGSNLTVNQPENLNIFLNNDNTTCWLNWTEVLGAEGYLTFATTPWLMDNLTFLLRMNETSHIPYNGMSVGESNNIYNDTTANESISRFYRVCAYVGGGPWRNCTDVNETVGKYTITVTNGSTNGLGAFSFPVNETINISDLIPIPPNDFAKVYTFSPSQNKWIYDFYDGVEWDTSQGFDNLSFSEGYKTREFYSNINFTSVGRLGFGIMNRTIHNGSIIGIDMFGWNSITTGKNISDLIPIPPNDFAKVYTFSPSQNKWIYDFYDGVEWDTSQGFLEFLPTYGYKTREFYSDTNISYEMNPY